MTLGSLFDGIGGFPYAAALLGIRALWASEIEKVPISITRRHFPDMQHVGDLTKLRSGKLPPVDIITFGSPCQDLSIAGKGARLDGARSGLFREAVRIVKEMREATDGRYPTFIIWENVPGAYSSHKGEDFRTVLQELCSIPDPGVHVPRPPGGSWDPAGCIMGEDWSLAWRTPDAQFWGVPQRRNRIYLVGDFRGHRAPQICFEPESLRGYPAPRKRKRQAAAGDAGESAYQAGARVAVGFQTSQSGTRLTEKHATLDANNGPRRYNGVLIAAFMAGQGSKAGGIGYSEESSPTLKSAASGTNLAPCVMTAEDRCAGAVDCLTPWDNQSFRVMSNKGISPTLSGCDGKGGRNPAGLVMTNAVAPVWPSINGTLTARHDGSPQVGQINSICCVATGQAGAEIAENKSPTLNCNHEQPYIAGDGMIVRRLTPRECERLQGLPDDWTRWGIDEKGRLIEHKDSPRYKGIGNGLAIPCAYYFLGGIVKYANIERQVAI